VVSVVEDSREATVCGYQPNFLDGETDFRMLARVPHKLAGDLAWCHNPLIGNRTPAKARRTQVAAAPARGSTNWFSFVGWGKE
jgi:hypothetical protein